MNVKKYTTQPGLLGSTVYHDLNGNKVGVARPRGLLDRIDYYDRNDKFCYYFGIFGIITGKYGKKRRKNNLLLFCIA